MLSPHDALRTYLGPIDKMTPARRRRVLRAFVLRRGRQATAYLRVRAW